MSDIFVICFIIHSIFDLSTLFFVKCLGKAEIFISLYAMHNTAYALYIIVDDKFDDKILCKFFLKRY
jgi:hypothetical protein